MPLRESKTLRISRSKATPNEESSEASERNNAKSERRMLEGHSPPASSAMAKSGSLISCCRSLNSSGKMGLARLNDSITPDLLQASSDSTNGLLAL